MPIVRGMDMSGNERINAAIDNLIVALNELRGALAEKEKEAVPQVIISDTPPFPVSEEEINKKLAEAIKLKEHLPAADGLKFCHMCGAELIPGDRFCINCGTPVEG